MDSLYLAAKVIIPIVLYMLVGYGMSARRWVTEGAWKEMNGMVFRLLLPVMVFHNVHRSDVAEGFDVGLILYAVLAVLTIFLAALAITRHYVKERTLAPVIVQGVYRSNFVLFGLQVTESIYGRGNAGMTAMLVTVIVPIFNALAVILFVCYGSKEFEIKKIMLGIVKNPLILASLLGMLFLLLRVPMPKVIEGVVETTGGMATPFALLVLGGTFTFADLRKYGRYISVVSVARLLLVPAVFLTVGVLLGYRQGDIVALMVLFASPTAVSSFSMASQMGGNGELAGQIVAVTSVMSVFGIFFWTYALDVLRLI